MDCLSSLEALLTECNRFAVSETRFQQLMAGHDSELLNKVMQKWKIIIDDDGVMYKVVFLKDIEDMKAEIEE